MLRWSATAAARLSSAATQLEPDEQEINPSFADVDSYDTCELSEGNYTLSNLSEILCAGKRLKEIIGMNPNSSKKLVLAPTKPLRLVGKGEEQTKLEFDISLLPGASLYLEALHLEGQIEDLENETSTDQSKMSYLIFVNCTVGPPEPDPLAMLELDWGIQDPFAWRGWLMVRDAALTLEINNSHLHGGAFVKQSRNFNLLASQDSSFDLEGQSFQLVNVTSHIQLEGVTVKVYAQRHFQLHNHPSFNMVLGRHEVHVAGSTFEGSAIEIKEPADLILDVSTTRFRDGQRAIVVTAREGNSSQVDLQDVEIHEFSELGVGASDFQIAMGL